MRSLIGILVAGAILAVLSGCGPAAGGFHIIDSTAPFAIITSPADGSQSFGATTVTFAASDAESDVNWVEVTVNGHTIYSSPQSGNMTGSAAFTPATGGSYVIQVIADSSGGRSTHTVTVHMLF
jgi:hypothetical protein